MCAVTADCVIPRYVCVQCAQKNIHSKSIIIIIIIITLLQRGGGGEKWESG